MYLSNNNTIIIFCPPNIQTGGPEALHQLASVLRELGHDSYMVYWNGGIINRRTDKFGRTILSVEEVSNPVVPYYSCYKVPFVWEFFDDKETTVVIPEIWPELLTEIHSSYKVFWFLAFLKYLKVKDSKSIVGYTPKILRRFLPVNSRFSHLKKYANLILCQSSLAHRYIQDKVKLPSYYVSDITKTSEVTVDGFTRKNVILYNKKGRKVISKIKVIAPEFEYKLLENMTAVEVHNAMASSKIFVDFGSHPGMDRMPREAVKLGCCLITNKSGTANCYDDVPILDKYKFSSPLKDLDRFREVVLDIYENYDQHLKNFSRYRRKIDLEKDEFHHAVSVVFGDRRNY